MTLVTKESDVQVIREDGSRENVPAGTPFEMPDDEAQARAAVKDVTIYTAAKQPEKTVAPAPVQGE